MLNITEIKQICHRCNSELTSCGICINPLCGYDANNADGLRRLINPGSEEDMLYLQHIIDSNPQGFYVQLIKPDAIIESYSGENSINFSKMMNPPVE